MKFLYEEPTLEEVLLDSESDIIRTSNGTLHADGDTTLGNQFDDTDLPDDDEGEL